VIQEEMAMTSHDVLYRRLGLALRDAQAAKASEEMVENFLKTYHFA
jgi:glycerol-3-phosphate dehydrogenase